MFLRLINWARHVEGMVEKRLPDKESRYIPRGRQEEKRKTATERTAGGEEEDSDREDGRRRRGRQRPRWEDCVKIMQEQKETGVEKRMPE